MKFSVEPTLFIQFECFEVEVYYAIILSIIALTFVDCLNERKFKSFFNTFWSYFSIILSDYFIKKIEKNFNRIIFGLWLMACTVLLAAFSNELWMQLIKRQDIVWIDSLEDLMKWKHIRIDAFEGGNLINYVENYDKEEMAINFKDRINPMNHQDFARGLKSLDYKGLMSGEKAFVIDFLTLQILKLNLISDGFKEDIDFHISEKGIIPQPYFTLTNKLTFNETLVYYWDFV